MSQSTKLAEALLELTTVFLKDTTYSLERIAEKRVRWIPSAKIRNRGEVIFSRRKPKY